MALKAHLALKAYTKLSNRGRGACLPGKSSGGRVIIATTLTVCVTTCRPLAHLEQLPRMTKRQPVDRNYVAYLILCRRSTTSTPEMRQRLFRTTHTY